MSFWKWVDEGETLEEWEWELLAEDWLNDHLDWVAEEGEWCKWARIRLEKEKRGFREEEEEYLFEYDWNYWGYDNHWFNKKLEWSTEMIDLAKNMSKSVKCGRLKKDCFNLIQRSEKVQQEIIQIQKEWKNLENKKDSN